MSLTEYGGHLGVRGLMYSNTKVAKQSGLKTFRKPDWYSKNKEQVQRLDITIF